MFVKYGPPMSIAWLESPTGDDETGGDDGSLPVGGSTSGGTGTRSIGGWTSGGTGPSPIGDWKLGGRGASRPRRRITQQPPPNAGLPTIPEPAYYLLDSTRLAGT
jgi:hypothetical protein